MQDLQEKLSKIFKKDVELKFKENRVSFLRAKIERTKVKLVLHKVFIDAPEEVFFHLKEYLMKKNRASLKELRKYLASHLKEVDYSDRLKIENLRPMGKVYNLEDILKDLTKGYFSDLEGLHITFFKKRKAKTRLTFGSYVRSFKLIKINELLDDEFFPLFFVSYVVYHEILHHLFPVKINEKGKRVVHGKDFKEAEKKYLFYKRAKSFEKEFLKKGRFHGWS